MKRFSKRFVPQIVIVLAAMPWLLGSTCGGAAIVAFSGTVPPAAINLNGTYAITVTDSGDASQLGTDPTVVIEGGLMTKLGKTVLTPTNIQNTGTNFIWTSAATIAYSANFSAVTTVTLNADLQADNKTLVGTFVFAAQSQTSQPLHVSLAKQ
jgi:hypothetical protein